MFNAAKDAFAAKTAQVFINERIVRYGNVQRLKLDSTKKQVEVVCQLIGEETPVTIYVGSYLVRSEGDKKFVQLSRCTCSRPWLQNLMADFVEGRRIEVPGWAASAL
jgi:hypothetical protein